MDMDLFGDEEDDDINFGGDDEEVVKEVKSIDDYEEPVEEMSASMEDLVEEVSDKEDKPYTSYKYDKKKETRERV